MLAETCPTCGSDKHDKFRAWSTAFGGVWIPWFTCDDTWHVEAAKQIEPEAQAKGSMYSCKL